MSGPVGSTRRSGDLPEVLMLAVAKEGRKDENQRLFPPFICSRIPVYCNYVMYLPDEKVF